ncbi:sodium:proton antiporter NhaD [Saccharospirillum salsuginis]|uniref:Sodium:proton antiporter n=1 Tax=Saccharospirillum salsuginis TaxID=418750 RepID=A0A918KDH6_9GAMM|nr:sodium:proton antiporter NhaD [Saccharospirillum salsuginis]GGX59398.1 sodium:proton antiporter [Saccharospirillum salsuginis]
MSLALFLIIAFFTLGYLAIIAEHGLKIDKTAPAIMSAVLCWSVYILFAGDLVAIDSLPNWFLEENAHMNSAELVHTWVGEHQLLTFLGEISSILFFLLGAMTIVEFVDAYGGFAIITDRITATRKVALLWMVTGLAFFMSAALDNLTTTIVMISLIRKLIASRQERLFFAGIIVVAANAGGAWSPIGDVTTTMLWIGGQITTLAIIKTLIIPSLVCAIVPMLWLSWSQRGQNVKPPQRVHQHEVDIVTKRHRNIIFGVGVGGLLFVPIFKTLTHLPPFMGMLLSLSVLWVVSEIIHHRADYDDDTELHITRILKRIDTPSVLFFLGILLAVSSLEATGLLHHLAVWLDETIGNINVIVFLIGLMSAVIDNVPLVAATMGMYDLSVYPTDHPTWEFLAYSAGTGGSCLIIGSAAGVAAMGMERINFFWYLKYITPLALLGYVAGAFTYQMMV